MEKINKKKKLYIVITILICLIGVTGFIAYVHMSENGDFKEDNLAQKGLLSNLSEDEIQAMVNQDVEKGYVNIYINKEPVFENGTSKGNVYIQNIPKNSYGFKVSIYLKGEEKSILDTGYIKPGYNVEYQKLNKNLKKGTYPAIAVFTSYQSEKDTKPISKTNVNITLTVRK